MAIDGSRDRLHDRSSFFRVSLGGTRCGFGGSWQAKNYAGSVLCDLVAKIKNNSNMTKQQLYNLNPIVDNVDGYRLQDVVDSIGWEESVKRHSEIRRLLKLCSSGFGDQSCVTPAKSSE